MEALDGIKDETPNRIAPVRKLSKSKALPGSIFRRSKSGSNKSAGVPNEIVPREDQQKANVNSGDASSLVSDGKDDTVAVTTFHTESKLQHNNHNDVSVQNLRITDNKVQNEDYLSKSNEGGSSTHSSVSVYPPPAPAPTPVIANQSVKKKQRSYRECQFERIITSNRIHLNELRSAAWNGIPSEHRSLAWKILLNYAPTLENTRQGVIQKKRNEYYDIVKKLWYDVPDAARSTSEQMGLRQVLVDIPRTLPEVRLFKNQRIRDMMARILYLYSLRNPSTGYVQGFNELLCPFVIVYISGYFGGREVKGCECNDNVHERNEKYVCIECVSDDILSEVEADAFHAISILLSKIQTHYTEDQPGLQQNIVKLSKVIKRVDNVLHNHLMDEGMLYQQMCFRWFHNFLLRETSVNHIIRMWDTYLSSVPSGFESFHIFVCAAIIVQDSEKLKSMSLEDIFQYIQSMNYDGDVDVLLSQAYVLSTLFDGNEAHLE